MREKEIVSTFWRCVRATLTIWGGTEKHSYVFGVSPMLHSEDPHDTARSAVNNGEYRKAKEATESLALLT